MALSSFWETMHILMGSGSKKSGKEVMEDVQDWVDRVIISKEPSVSEHGDENIPIGQRRASRNERYNYFQLEIDIRCFLRGLKLPKIECNFNHPRVRSRLEKLMGSNYVSLTDRNYMQKLQHRILEDYADSMEKMIKVREAQEMERVKNLVLVGKIPLDQAPAEMSDHPIMLIEEYCNQLIQERRAKMRRAKVKIPTYLYWDDTPDPPSGLSIEKGHIFRSAEEKLCIPVDKYLTAAEGEEIENGYMFSDDEYNKIKYESPSVRQLMECQTVEEMYNLADEIIGVLQTIEEPSKGADDTATVKTNPAA